jgi:hypothetical protein
MQRGPGSVNHFKDIEDFDFNKDNQILKDNQKGGLRRAHSSANEVDFKFNK